MKKAAKKRSVKNVKVSTKELAKLLIESVDAGLSFKLNIIVRELFKWDLFGRNERRFRMGT